MNYKVYTEGSQLIIEDESGRQFVGLSKDVMIRRAGLESDNPQFYVSGVVGWAPFEKLTLSETLDSAGNPFVLADFKTFYQTELGKASAGSAASTTTSRISNVTLLPIGWVQNGTTLLYEYTYSNVLITLSTAVEIVPHNESLDEVIAAEVSPYTSIQDGGVMLFANNSPTSDIIVDILVKPVQDV